MVSHRRRWGEGEGEDPALTRGQEEEEEAEGVGVEGQASSLQSSVCVYTQMNTS